MTRNFIIAQHHFTSSLLDRIIGIRVLILAMTDNESWCLEVRKELERCLVRLDEMMDRIRGKKMM